MDLGSARLLKLGVANQKVEALPAWRESNLFDDRERAALEDAQAMTRSELRVNDDAIVELAGLIAFQNMSSKFDSALGVPAQGFCPLSPAIAPN